MLRSRVGLFIHDHRFGLRDGMALSPGKLPASIWGRYLPFCERLLVVGRRYSGPAGCLQWETSSGPNVEMRLLESLGVTCQDGRRLSLGRLLREIREADFAVVRHPSVLGALFFEYLNWLKKPVVVEVVGHAQAGFGAKGGG